MLTMYARFSKYRHYKYFWNKLISFYILGDATTENLRGRYTNDDGTHNDG